MKQATPSACDSRPEIDEQRVTRNGPSPPSYWRYAKDALARAVAAPRRSLAKALHASGRCYCPVCESRVRRFLPFGERQRANALCPLCHSLERHRLDWLFLRERTSIFDGRPRRMLHVAPEEFLARRFRAVRNLDYLSADLESTGAMVRMDITSIGYPDGSFSFVYCSHVLEHIPDDRRALAELYRVLEPGGWALLTVPITAERTVEDFSIVDPEERRKHFGQSDHVRRCGPDYIERMKAAGFTAKIVRAGELASPPECIRMGITRGRRLFSCRKPPPA